jgi:Rho family protein
MLCFSVDSPDSLENVESKWVGEITENCPGVKLVLVALKCDLREQEEDDREEGREPKKPTIDYKQGLAVAERVKALRYLGKFGLLREAACRIAGDVTREPATDTSTECSAMKNRGVNEAFTEAARVALTVKSAKGDKDSTSCSVM